MSWKEQGNGGTCFSERGPILEDIEGTNDDKGAFLMTRGNIFDIMLLETMNWGIFSRRNIRNFAR